MFSGAQNFSPRHGAASNDNTTRLPPIVGASLDQVAFLDRPFDVQIAMDDRRARQQLEEQMKVITSVCKKLNQDIEMLDRQLNEKTFTLNNLEFKANDIQASSVTLNKDLQFKLARHDNTLVKLESDHVGMQHGLKEQHQHQQDFARTVSLRLTDIENRIGELNSKFDSVMMEQTMVLKNVEGDTVKQLQLIDSKTRTMLEDVRSQLHHTRTSHETGISRLETRFMIKIEEGQRTAEKCERFDRKLEEHTASVTKRFQNFEEDFQRHLNKLTGMTENLDNKVNRTIDDRFKKQATEFEKLKRDLKTGFENVHESIVSLQRLVESKLRLTEEKLEKEMDKIRKMVVLM